MKLVMKFGGSSVADVEKMRRCAKLVKARAAAGDRVVTVVSALDGMTEELLALADAAGASNRPAMSYYDVRNADLKVARFNGSVWSSQTVAAKGFVGMYSNIRIKAGTGELEVLYYNRERDSVFCAESSGSTWTLSELFVGGGRWLAAAEASDGGLTLSCLSGDGLSVVDL